jgi:nucleoside-diphosphate-sugar epimerase
MREHQQGMSLVTGASGFVGGWLVKHLRDQGHPVRGMVRNEAKSEALRALGAEVVVANLKDEQSLRSAVVGCDYVYHIGALFREAGLPESEYYEVNTHGVRRILDAAIGAGVKRVVHCSTVGVLGNVEQPPANEQTPYNPGDIYQVTKMEGEKIALEYFRSGRISGVVLRPAMIYGPGDERTLKLFRMIARRRFFYVGNGRATVHWIDVRDLARAFVLAMKKSETSGEIFIISGRDAVPLSDMCSIVAKALGVPPPRLHLPVKPMRLLGSLCEAICTPLRIQPPIFKRRVDFFTKNRHFDGSKAKNALGFETSRSIEEEIHDLVNSYRAECRL